MLNYIIQYATYSLAVQLLYLNVSIICIDRESNVFDGVTYEVLSCILHLQSHLYIILLPYIVVLVTTLLCRFSNVCKA